MRRLTLLAFGLHALACSDRDPAEGIGRDPYVPYVPGTRSGLVITEVYAADPTASARFVEIANPTAETVSLVGLSLEDGGAVVALVDIDGTTSLAAGATHPFVLGALVPSPSAGELAIVDDDGLVHDYIAWGASPSLLGTSLAARAAVSGRAGAASIVPVGFPMPAGIAVVRVGVDQGCAPASVGSAATGSVAGSCAGDPSVIRLSELVTGRDQAMSWVELENTTTEAINLYGVRLCQMPRCVVLGRDAVIPPLDFLQVVLGLADASNTTPRTQLATATPLAAIGELALLPPSAASIDDSTPISDYVRYGGGGSVLLARAVAQQRWASEADVALAPRLGGEAVARNPVLESGTPGAGIWNPARATPNAANPDIIDAGDWTSCSYPEPWSPAPVSDLVIAHVYRGDAGVSRIVLVNRGEGELSAAGLRLEIVAWPDDEDPVLLDLPLEPMVRAMAGSDVWPVGNKIIVELHATVATCSAKPCLTPSLGSRGELLLRQDAGALQYLRWGSAASLLSVPGNLWPPGDPNGPCSIDAALGVGGEIVLDLTAPGTSVPDYTVSP